ncbi:MAG: MerR family DNA-binding transcriptional regulator [Rhodobacteraceae bacterium]|nr:MerR family DNA-binding transcriptional regulator [Paracoccaceae bacterium]
MTDDVMTIRAMCDSFGVTPRTLRFYETKELLAPRRDGQRCLYTRRDRARLALTLRGKRFGFSLEEIRQILDLYNREDGPAEQLASGCAAARRQLADLTRRRADLDAVINDLRAQIAWADDALRALNRQTAAE